MSREVRKNLRWNLVVRILFNLRVGIIREPEQEQGQVVRILFSLAVQEPVVIREVTVPVVVREETILMMMEIIIGTPVTVVTLSFRMMILKRVIVLLVKYIQFMIRPAVVRRF